MKIILAINWVNYSNPDKKKHQETAISVLLKNKPQSVMPITFNYEDESVRVPNSFFVFKTLHGDSQKDLGNNRRMPYIKEILDYTSNMPCDIFGYINSDILLDRDFFKTFNKNSDAYVFYKKDIEEIDATNFLAGKIKIVSEKPDGVDAFFFRKQWWNKHKGYFPKGLILGETEWDTVYNSIIQKISNNYVLKRALHHIAHDRIWSISSRGAINNMLIWNKIKETCGIPQFIPETKG